MGIFSYKEEKEKEYLLCPYCERELTDFIRDGNLRGCPHCKCFLFRRA